ncbi:uncharacterized protein RB166_021081 isoform 2-T2 [Leptodactylus fuscus]
MLLLLNDPVRMDKDSNEIARRMLDFTLEIISLLSGEEHTKVKWTTEVDVTPNSHIQESAGCSRNRGRTTEPGEGWRRSRGPITEPGGGGSRSRGPITEPGGGGSRSRGPITEPGGGWRRSRGPITEPGGGGSRSRGPITEPGGGSRSRGPITEPGGGSRSRGPITEPGGGGSRSRGPISEPGGGGSRSRGPITAPPPLSLIHEQKILELTNKMIELLTGEVPIRCQDVAVYFSMEEWEYLEGHEDRYKEAMMENDPPRMEEDRSHIAAEMLHLTLEIVDIITGEVYTVLKKSSGESVTSRVSGGGSRGPITEPGGGGSRSRGPITAPPPLSLIHEQKILELTNKMLELLTGEVPIRCQDVAVYFSMEECEYLEGHEDRYKEVMMEDQWPLTSPDGFSRSNLPESCTLSPLYSQDCPEEKVSENPLVDASKGVYLIGGDHTWDLRTSMDGRDHGEDLMDIKIEVIDEEETDVWADQQYGLHDRNPPERCPLSPLYSQDCPEENVPNSQQGEDVTDIKAEAEEERMRGRHLCKREVEEEIPGGVTTGNPDKEPEGKLLYCINYKGEEEDILQCSPGENLITLNVHPGLHSTDPSYNPPNPKDSAYHKWDQSFQCVDCGKQYAQRSSLFRHRRIHTVENPYSCSLCGKCFINRSHLVIHQRIHTGEKPYSCSECGKRFTIKSHLVIHGRSHTGEKPYPCLQCGKCFTQKSHLVKHEKSHTGEKPYSCSECGKCFNTKAIVRDHQRIHTGEKPFICSECGRCFTDRSSLFRHKRVHTGEKPYSCSECGKCFTDKSGLVIHGRIHTGEKPYLCSECGKSFTNTSNLAIHEKTHTGEKPFSCSECGKCFTTKTKFKDHHQKHHTGKKPFSCSECGEGFTKKSHLRIHQKGHTEKKPYSCLECGKCYKSKKRFVTHQVIHRH